MTVLSGQPHLCADCWRQGRSPWCPDRRMSGTVRGCCVLIILCCPHLMLSHIGDDDGISLGHPVDLFDDMPGRSACLMVVFQRILFFQLLDVCQPFCMILGQRLSHCQLASGLSFMISDHGCSHMNVLVDLCRVDIHAGRLFAFLANLDALPMTRSLNRAPMHNQQVALGTCRNWQPLCRAYPAMPVYSSSVPVKSALVPSAYPLPGPASSSTNALNSCRRIGKDGAAAHQIHRASSLSLISSSRLFQALPLIYVGLRSQCVPGTCRLIFGHGRRHILGNIHQHRAGTACLWQCGTHCGSYLAS